MGNNRSKGSSSVEASGESKRKEQQTRKVDEKQNDSFLSGRSFSSISSHQSTFSAQRPWSRVSRRRWKESTLTLPYECSKTAWPVLQLEAAFLPDFPVVSSETHSRRYHILEEIACGAFGKVYKAEDNENGKVFALKVLSKSRIIKENSVQQVKDEVQIQRVCGHHPFIVNCPAHWQSRKRLYIVSEFIEGGELYKLLEAYLTLPVIIVQIYVAQIASALDFLHNAGVIYRDLKPENLLLDQLSGDVQLIDFGLAKWLSYGGKTATLCGTPRYMAPEVASLQPYGHAADWWSLGVIACMMLTGKFPAPAIFSENGAENNVEKPGTLPENAEIDLASHDLLKRLLEIDPKRRLRSLRTLKTIAFYKGFNFDDVIKKKVKPAELLKKHFPDGPAKKCDEEETKEIRDAMMQLYKNPSR